MYPYSPYPYVASIATSPYYGYGGTTGGIYPPMPGDAGPVLPLSPYRGATTQMVSNQTAVPPVSYIYPTTHPSSSIAPYSNYAATRPAFPWPAWTGANGPLFRQDLLRQSQTTPYAYNSPSIGSYNYPMMASQSHVNGALRPSTSLLLPPEQSAAWGNYGGTQTFRDPIQAGLPPTVLR